MKLGQFLILKREYSASHRQKAVEWLMKLMKFGCDSFQTVSPLYTCKWITELCTVNNKFYNKVSKVCKKIV